MVRPLGRETIGKHPAVPNPPNGGLVASDRAGVGSLERGIEGYRRVVADGWLRPIQRQATNHLPGGI